MTKAIYKSGELGIDKHQAITEIFTTKKGLKVELWSCDWDTKNMAHYIEETEEWNRNTDFSKVINEYGTTEGECFTEALSQALTDPDFTSMNIYRTVEL